MTGLGSAGAAAPENWFQLPVVRTPEVSAGGESGRQEVTAEGRFASSCQI